MMFLSIRTDDANVYDCHATLRGSGEYAGASKRVGHPRHQYVTGLQERAAECERLGVREVAIRLVDVLPISNVRQLNQAHVPFRVLVFRLYPVAIHKHPGGRHSVDKGGHGPPHFSIPSSSFIPRWISSSSFASSARISLGGRCSISSCTISL